ncbi:MAG: hypothetical protein ACFFDU_08920 [Candidatus Thorarchaeota archaeon]
MSSSKKVSDRIKTASIAQITGVVLIWYCLAIIGSRLITVVVAPGIGIETGIYHYHHILWGLILMTLGGFIGLYWDSRGAMVFGAFFLGLGLGLAVDEVGLILVTADAGYWDPITYPIMIIVAQLLFIACMAARQQGR